MRARDRLHVVQRITSAPPSDPPPLYLHSSEKSRSTFSSATNFHLHIRRSREADRLSSPVQDRVFDQVLTPSSDVKFHMVTLHRTPPVPTRPSKELRGSLPATKGNKGNNGRRFEGWAECAGQTRVKDRILNSGRKGCTRLVAGEDDTSCLNSQGLTIITGAHKNV